MSFENVIDQKLKELESSQRDIRAAATDGNYHVSRITEVVQSAAQQVEEISDDLTKEELLLEFKSVLLQVPDAVRLPWSQAASSLQAVDQEISRWIEMKEMYTSFKAQQEQAAVEREVQRAKVDEAIASGEIEEPSRKTGRERKPGARPPITLGNFRRNQSEIESGEDSEG